MCIGRACRSGPARGAGAVWQSVGPSSPRPDGGSGLAELPTQGPDRDVELLGHGRQRFAVEVHECRTSEAATNVEYDIVWAWDRELGISPWPRLQWGGLPVAIPENRLRGVGPGSRSAEVA